jgi:hypothetical protein
VIGRGGATVPFVEVENRDLLSEAIEDMLKKARLAAPAKTQTATSKKKAS